MSTCKKLSSAEYICQNPIIHPTTERSVCETLLKNPLQKTIPADCPTKTIKAKLEIWHRLSPNSWLFVISQKLIASVSCDRSNSHIDEDEFVGTGIFHMNARCKCYTLSTVLTSTSNKSTHHIGYLPMSTVLNHECCIKHHQFLQHGIEMEPIQLQNLNLDDLRHSHYKLQQFEKILDEKLRQSQSIYHILVCNNCGHSLGNRISNFLLLLLLHLLLVTIHWRVVSQTSTLLQMYWYLHYQP